MTHFGFAKIGEPIITEARASLLHLRIYWTLAKSIPSGKNRCKIGQRYIANYLKVSQKTVNRKLEDLIRWGHLIKIEVSRGERGCYELTDPVFLLKPKHFGGKTKKRNREAQKAANWADSRKIVDDIMGVA